MASIRGLSLKSELLLDAGFCHGFSTREGSSGEGFDAFLREAGIDRAQLRQVHQVHGPRAVHASALPPSGPEAATVEADAIVASTPHAVAVRVADCVPVLLAAPATGIVAAVHAGWRGLVSGVIGAAADEMSVLAPPVARGGTRSSWLAAIGPSIGPCCFEVGVDVARQIAEACGDAAIACTGGDKAFVDLRLAARLRLIAAGFSSSQVDDVAGCTKCDASRFFSYRRDGANAGRLFGAIAARAPR
jgi:YfiH family protein